MMQIVRTTVDFELLGYLHAIITLEIPESGVIAPNDDSFIDLERYGLWDGRSDGVAKNELERRLESS